MSHMTQRLRALGVAGILGAAAIFASPAEAWWHGGVFVGLPPVVVAPGYYAPYYYPPAYYPPAYYPPGYYPPPYGYAPPAYGTAAPPAAPQAKAETGSQGQVAYGAMCYAGIYHCAAPANTPIGRTCSCPGIGAPSYGSVQ
jgi:hypothetical protein